jgi:uncharacterized protein (TIGR00251 family)
MIIEVHVITNAKKRELRLEGHYLKVKITALPKEGKANAALIEFFADFFGVRKSEVKMVRGEKEKKKIISLPISEEEFKRAIGKEMAD